MCHMCTYRCAGTDMKICVHSSSVLMIPAAELVTTIWGLSSRCSLGASA